MCPVSLRARVCDSCGISFIAHRSDRSPSTSSMAVCRRHHFIIIIIIITVIMIFLCTGPTGPPAPRRWPSAIASSLLSCHCYFPDCRHYVHYH